MTDMTTGAPMSAVTELTGKAPSNPGIRAMMLQVRAIAAPTRRLAGMRTLWSEVRNRPLHRCGTASPRKAIGPQ